MTNDEWIEAVRLYSTYWRYAALEPDQIVTWAAQLRDQPGPRVHQAIFDLAADRDRPPAVAAIRQRCKEIARDEAMTRTNTLTPFGSDEGDWRDRRWNALSADEQTAWLTKARALWPDWLPIRDDSPLLRAHAAALERGVPTTPDHNQPAGRCRSCSGQLLLVDRETATAKCNRCHAEYTVMHT